MFDSGIGGLSILKALLCQRRDLDIYYWADDAHTPYGSKSDDYVKARCQSICQSFIERDIKLIVVACNTATAIAINDLRADFQGVTFVGIEPYVNVVNHIPWQAEHRAVILTTPLTGRSERFTHLKSHLDPDHKLEHFSCPELAKIVEHAFWQGSEDIKALVRQELLPIQDRHYEYAILGCTHYPLLAPLLADLLPHVTLIDCGEHAAWDARCILENAGRLASPNGFGPGAAGQIRFYLTDVPTTFEEVARHFLGFPIATPQRVTIDHLCLEPA